jgi:pimeloyl-ACP methyl ester carboxylesterase
MVFFDQRGHGRSEKGTRESHKVEQLAVDLEQVIDTVAPTGPIILVGHSMGGMTVQQLAAKRPDLFGTRIKAVVLACTSAGGVTEVPLGLPTVVGRFIQGIAPHVTGALSGEQAFVTRSLESGNDLTLLLTRRYSFGTGSTPDLTAFVAKMHSVTPIEVIGDFLAAFGGYNSVETLPILGQVDTVVVAATDDLLTPLSHSEKIASLIPNAELIEIADTGHMLPMERYIEFNEIISAVAQRVRMNQA